MDINNAFIESILKEKIFDDDDDDLLYAYTSLS